MKARATCARFRSETDLPRAGLGGLPVLAVHRSKDAGAHQSVDQGKQPVTFSGHRQAGAVAGRVARLVVAADRSGASACLSPNRRCTPDRAMSPSLLISSAANRHSGLSFTEAPPPNAFSLPPPLREKPFLAIPGLQAEKTGSIPRQPLCPHNLVQKDKIAGCPGFLPRAFGSSVRVRQKRQASWHSTPPCSRRSAIRPSSG